MSGLILGCAFTWPKFCVKKKGVDLYKSTEAQMSAKSDVATFINTTNTCVQICTIDKYQCVKKSTER